MQYATLLFDFRDNVAHITLNRPEAANSINTEMAIDQGLKNVTEGQQAHDKLTPRYTLQLLRFIESVAESVDRQCSQLR